MKKEMSLYEWLFILFMFLHFSGYHHFAVWQLAAPLIIGWVFNFISQMMTVYFSMNDLKSKFFSWLLDRSMAKARKRMDKENEERTMKLAERMAAKK